MDPTLLIGDIVEHDTDTKKPVDFSDTLISTTGFPQHKKRWRTSTFKQRRAGNAIEGTAQSDLRPQRQTERQRAQAPSQGSDFEAFERRRIDQENRQKLESMSPAEIAQAQQDIMNGLNPALIQRLLKRANIDESSGPSPFDPTPSNGPETPEASEERQNAPEVQVEDTSKAPVPESLSQQQSQATVDGAPPESSKKIAEGYDEDSAPPQIPPDLFPITDQPKSTHFPVPPALPDLDPSDPNFLATLHEKYFPNLPADPSKLAWMAPVPSKDSPADKDSPYYPHPEISISALRFDFKGRFLSPRVSRSIPSTKGLHHHGEAPEAAGYTIAELARLARSAVPAQRCMAYQTLGRILYRLGQGEWGKTEDNPIAMGVWNSIKQGRVLESLTEAAMGEGGHRGSRAYATEALWLFEKGGWREKFKGR